MAGPELLLDSSIRMWVLLPIVCITFFVGIIRHYATQLLHSEKKVDLQQVSDSQMLLRSRVLRENGKYIPRQSFTMRKHHFNNAETGFFKKVKRNVIPKNPMTGGALMLLPVVWCFRHQHVDRHDEGKPDQRPAHDSDWWMDQLGFLWICNNEGAVPSDSDVQADAAERRGPDVTGRFLGELRVLVLPERVWTEEHVQAHSGSGQRCGPVTVHAGPDDWRCHGDAP
ncbi:uncharacterized protein LOC114439068 isoform X3 [Parambassis ranga]|uniref:ER membrane protein complex subunit 3 n=1 Tax=Parambassis ranga TaxID=210632 RepID=A0A6P7ISQ8_9TELE|nr:uncharacterized protein LOC114439068 isoform X3 [Parambassis ranga]